MGVDLEACLGAVGWKLEGGIVKGGLIAGAQAVHEGTRSENHIVIFIDSKIEQRQGASIQLLAKRVAIDWGSSNIKKAKLVDGYIVEIHTSGVRCEIKSWTVGQQCHRCCKRDILDIRVTTDHKILPECCSMLTGLTDTISVGVAV